MVERRGNFEARLSVVEALTVESRLTWVMLRSRLSHAKARAILAELTEGGFVEQTPGEYVTYRLTPKGRAALDAWISLKKTLEVKHIGQLQG